MRILIWKCPGEAAVDRYLKLAIIREPQGCIQRIPLCGRMWYTLVFVLKQVYAYRELRTAGA